VIDECIRLFIYLLFIMVWLSSKTKNIIRLMQ